MVEEIDLRAYIEVLLRHWMWILGLAVLAAIIGFVVATLQPTSYQTSALVLVTEPRYEIQFDARLRTQDAAPMYRAFTRLAISDDVLQDLIDALSTSPDAKTKEWSRLTLLETIEATVADDRNMVILQATAHSPNDAAAIANEWADAFTKHSNKTFGETEDDLVFFEEQLEQAREALNEADSDLVEFQARNQTNIVSARLNSLRNAQNESLDQQRSIGYLIRDIDSLREQLTEQPDDQPLSTADYLTALLLQVKAFNLQGSAPIELQLGSGESLSGKSPADQIAFLDNLRDVLEAKSSEIDAYLAELEPQILTTQQKAEEYGLEQDRLARARDLARETYLVLARKVDEARIAAQEANKLFRVGSYARVPRVPMPRQRIFKTAAAGMLGLLVGVCGAFFVEFWRRSGGETKGADD